MRPHWLETFLFWTTRVGALLMPFTLLAIIDPMFFPFITGKNLLFRISVEIMLGAWIGLLLINFKKYWPKWNFVLIAFTAFVGIGFISSVLGVNFLHSFWSNFERMEGVITHLHLLAFLFVLAGTFRVKKDWLWMFGASVLASLGVAFYGMLEYTGLIPTVADSSRIISTLGNPLYVAVYLLFNLFLIGFLFINLRHKLIRWALILVGLFNFSMFFLTGARGAFVGLVGGVGILLLIYVFVADGARKKIIAAGALAFLIMIPISLNLLKYTPFIQNNSVLSRFSDISLAERTVQSRFTIWGMAFESFKQRPVFGWGVGNFIVPYSKNYNPAMHGNEAWFDRTHNAPLEWLVSTGILGFMAYISIFIAILWALIRSVKKGILDKSTSLLFVGMFITYLTQMLFVFDTIATYLMLVIMLGFFYAISFAKKDDWFGEGSVSVRDSEPTIQLAAEKTYNKKELILQRREERREEKKVAEAYKVPGWKIAGSFMALALMLVLTFSINIRSWQASSTLIYSLYGVRNNFYAESMRAWRSALDYSRGTSGEQEVREHLALSVLQKAAEDLSVLEDRGFQDLFVLAGLEMEAQIDSNSFTNPKIKQNALLAQLYALGGVYTGDKGLFQQALAEYRKINNFAPNYVYLYPAMINAFLRAGNLPEAIAYAESAEDILRGVDKFEKVIFYNKPLLYASVGRYDDAYLALKDIAENYPNPAIGQTLNPELTATITRNLFLRGEEGAIDLLEKIHELDPTLRDTTFAIAESYARQGNNAKAVFYASKALQNDPDIQEEYDKFIETLGNRVIEKGAE